MFVFFLSCLPFVVVCFGALIDVPCLFFVGCWLFGVVCCLVCVVRCVLFVV